MVFVVDESGSIGEADFQLFREFIENVSSVLSIGQNNSRVAIITFNNAASLYFNLNEHSNRPSFVNAVRNLPYNGGGTDIAEALTLLRETAQNGLLGISENNRQVAMFMTDGQSNAEDTRIAAEALHNADIFQVYAIGVSGADITQLNVIANNNSDLVFFSSTFDSDLLRLIEDEVIEDLCEGSYIYTYLLCTLNRVMFMTQI